MVSICCDISTSLNKWIFDNIHHMKLYWKLLTKLISIYIMYCLRPTKEAQSFFQFSH